MTKTITGSLAMMALAGCFPMGGLGQPATQSMSMSAQAPMTNADALAYVQAHRSSDLKVMTAVNHLSVPICRLVFLSVEHRQPFVNQSGPTDPQRGNTDPSKTPLLAPGADGIVMFPDVPPPSSGAMLMTVTAFGCFRNNVGMYVVDEDAVVFQKSVPVADQGKLAISM